MAFFFPMAAVPLALLMADAIRASVQQFGDLAQSYVFCVNLFALVQRYVQQSEGLLPHVPVAAIPFDVFEELLSIRIKSWDSGVWSTSGGNAVRPLLKVAVVPGLVLALVISSDLFHRSALNIGICCVRLFALVLELDEQLL